MNVPFATNTNLNEAAQKADVSHESRNGFLQKLLGEHSIHGARQQLKELWGKWIETHYGAAGPESTGRGYSAEVETPEDSDDGSGSYGSQSPESAGARAAAAAEQFADAAPAAAATTKLAPSAASTTKQAAAAEPAAVRG